MERLDTTQATSPWYHVRSEIQTTRRLLGREVKRKNIRRKGGCGGESKKKEKIVKRFHEKDKTACAHSFIRNSSVFW